MKTNFLAMVA
jgi:hypothetical protein